MGYEAKLRNAKLSYYKGDFQLAQEHLDILKQATTREIANDAMDLSMRIKENIAYDTAGIALQQFASIELLLVQNKVDLALTRLDEFVKPEKVKMSKEEAFSRNYTPANPTTDQSDSIWVEIPSQASTSILDDVYWLEANLRMKRGEFDLALVQLERIVTEFGDDVLADDATFTRGDIYENYLKNKVKAMEIYRAFLDKYPGSVYAAEARKRYRILRGDFQEKVVN